MLGLGFYEVQTVLWNVYFKEGAKYLNPYNNYYLRVGTIITLVLLIQCKVVSESEERDLSSHDVTYNNLSGAIRSHN